MTHKIREWETEFNDKFGGIDVTQSDWDALKLFIHQELQKAYTKGRSDEAKTCQGCQGRCEQELQKAREEEREKIEAIFKEHVPPHAMDLEDSVWLKRLLNKVFNHDKNI